MQLSKVSLANNSLLQVQNVQDTQPKDKISQIRLTAVLPQDIPSLGTSLEQNRNAVFTTFVQKLRQNLDPNYQTERIKHKLPATTSGLFNDFFNTEYQYAIHEKTLKIDFAAFCKLYLPDSLKIAQDSWEAYEIMLKDHYNQGLLNDCLENYMEALGLSLFDTPIKLLPSDEETKVAIATDIVYLKLSRPTATLRNVCGSLEDIVNHYISDRSLRQVYFSYACRLFDGVIVDPDRLA